MRTWHVTTFDDEAFQEITAFFNDEDVKAEIKRILNLLASQEDPRRPTKSARLIVNRIEHDAPDWFRVKVPRYAICIIFRLLVERDGKTVEVPIDAVVDASEKRYIDITRVGRHPDVYGPKLRHRYKKLHPKR